MLLIRVPQYSEEDRSAKFSCVPKPTVLACRDGGWEEDGGPLIKLGLRRYRLTCLYKDKDRDNMYW